MTASGNVIPHEVDTWAHNGESFVWVRMPSVVRAVRELKRLELVVQEPYSSISLTEKGRRVAHQVFDRHRLLRSFLEKLGVSRRIADRDACLMEHILSAETLERIRTYTETERK